MSPTPISRIADLDLPRPASPSGGVLETLAATTVGGLGVAMRLRHPDLGAHCDRVTRLSKRLALESGIHPSVAGDIALAASLHDLGKICVPDSIVLKPGPLDPAEWAAMRQHCERGHEVLREIDHPIMRLAADIARHHHEAWDGSGYPDGLAGEGIPIAARVVALADCYDAMRERRPYRDGMSHAQAVRAILVGDARGGPGRYDPALLNVFAADPDGIVRRAGIDIDDGGA